MFLRKFFLRAFAPSREPLFPSQGPKARPKPAQGNALGKWPVTAQAPKGRANVHLNFHLNFLPLLLLLPTAHADITYQQTIRPLFQNSCLNCHNPDKHKAGLDLSTYDSTMDGSDNGKVVDTTNPEKSLLFKVLSHAEEPFMPKGADKLPDSQLDQIRQWIAASAPDKSGAMVAKKESGPAVSAVLVEAKPKGPPAMPHDGLLDPVIRTARTGAVPSVAGSPWAPLVALAAQKQVLLYNTDSFDLVGVLPFPEGFPAVVRFSHNGSLLIVGGGIGAKLGHVVIFDVITGRRVIEIGDEFDTVLAADISPDQTLVALGGPSRIVKIFSAADGAMICKIKKHTDWVTALCFTPDGKQLISADRAGGLSVWDTQGHEIQSISAHTAAITGIACRGPLVATSSEDGAVKFWDIEEGKETKSWHAHNGGVRSIAFTPDGRILTSGRDHLVKLWDPSGNLIKQFDPLGDIAMQAAAAGGKIIASDWTGLVRVWTPDGSRAGDLDSNPPTIAQRIDASNKRLAALQPLQSQARDACARATADLAAARKLNTDATALLAAKKSALASTKARIITLAMQFTATIQKPPQDDLGPIAWAAAANPLLLPITDSIFTSRSQSLCTQQSALASACNQYAALPQQIDLQSRALAATIPRIKSAESALAAAHSAQESADNQIKAVTLDLQKWHSAESRLAAPVQYASGNKPAPK